MARSVLIALPAYNEEQNIAHTLQRVASFGDVIVFNNNSFDKTQEIVESLGFKVELVSEKGYESVIYSIADFFLSSNYEKLVIADGDGEVGLESIPLAIKKLNSYQVVIGQRDKIKRIGESLICRLFHSKYFIKDIYCGFKCFTKKGISSVRVSNTFGTAVVNKNSSIYNIPVIVRSRKGSSKLGDGLVLNLKLLICGLRGFLN
jgi:glycosyltransferase involved in cell wall biosynthesis